MFSPCLSRGDCNSLLAKFADCELLTYSLEPYNNQSEHQLLTLIVKTSNEEKELSFFVKLQSKVLHNVFNYCNFFEKEVFVYDFVHRAKNLIPKIHIKTPLMYYSTNGTIVLEDLRKQGYVGYNYKYDEKHMIKAITSLAKFHAISFAFEEHESKELKRKYEIYEDFSQYLRGPFMDNEKSSGYKCINSAIALVEKVYENDELFKEKIRTFRQIFFDRLNKPNKEYRRVISHGDLRGNNMVFRYNNSVPEDCKLVDFQFVCYLPPAFDITMLIYRLSPKDFYQKLVHNYYDLYYTSLSEALSNLNIDIAQIYPLQEYKKSCREYMQCNKFLWLCYIQGKYELNVHQLKENLVDLKGMIKFVEDNDYEAAISETLEDNRFTFMGDLVTVEDCFKVISSKIGSNNYQLISWELEKIEDRTGSLGEHYFLIANILFDGNTKIVRFFVKVCPQNVCQKQFMDESGMSFKEMQFFNRIIPDFNGLGIRCLQEIAPKCYLAEEDLLILDDLKDLGYRIKPIRDGISLETLKCSVVALAKLHASGIIFEEKRKIRLNELYSREFKEAFYNNCESAENMKKSGIKGYAQMIKLFSNYSSNITPDTFLEMLSNLLDSMVELVLPSVKYRNTICHGDAWCNNILIKEDISCVLVDFQSYRYGPPAFDLMQHIYFSTNRQMRSSNMRLLLDIYYDEFKRVVESHDCEIESILKYGDFLECCENSKTFAIMQASDYLQNIALSPESNEALMADPEYFNYSMYEDRTEFIKENCGNDSIYKSCLEDITLELRDLCESIAKRNK